MVNSSGISASSPGNPARAAPRRQERHDGRFLQRPQGRRSERAEDFTERVIPLAVEYADREVIVGSAEHLGMKCRRQGNAYLIIILDGGSDEEVYSRPSVSPPSLNKPMPLTF